MNAAAWVALFGIVGTLLGAFGGKWIDNNSERKRWRRDQRGIAYQRVLAIAPVISATGGGNAAENEHVREMFDALAAVEVYGSDEARALAYKVANIALEVGTAVSTSGDLRNAHDELVEQCRRELR